VKYLVGAANLRISKNTWDILLLELAPNNRNKLQWLTYSFLNTAKKAGHTVFWALHNGSICNPKLNNG
jgi:hypothetical protein